jgi:hypothetical protein
MLASYYYTNKVALCFRSRRPCMTFGNEMQAFICLQERKKEKITTLPSQLGAGPHHILQQSFMICLKLLRILQGFPGGGRS